LELRRRDTKENQVAYIGWRSESPDDKTPDGPASYSITLSEGLASQWGLDLHSSLVFSLADTDEKPPEPENENEEDVEDEDETEEEGPPDLTVELATSDGVSARFPLSRFRATPPVLRSRFTKFWNEENLYGSDYEPALQIYELPLSEFCTENPDLDPSSIETIRFVFDRTEEGVIILDDIGFAQLEGAN
jgi:hypothetical protein